MLPGGTQSSRSSERALMLRLEVTGSDFVWKGYHESDGGNPMVLVDKKLGMAVEETQAVASDLSRHSSSSPTGL